MRIDLAFPRMPPVIDGIGDHTARLAKQLAARGWKPRILTAQDDWTPVPGTSVRQAFHRETRRGVLPLVDAVRDAPPDWFLLQFEQFSYGRWGLNPFVPLVLHRIRQVAPETRRAVMFHEDYMRPSDLTSAMMSTWQQAQFWMIGQLADVAFFATQPRARRYADWFSDTPVHAVPVGSNIPDVQASRREARTHLSLDPEAFVIGMFGSAHASRLLAHVEAAASACARCDRDSRVVYAGPDGEAVEAALSGCGVPVRNAGTLPPEGVSRAFAAMDVHLAPFDRGVSMRRGSFLTGLQHGVATVTTRGPETGGVLARNRGEAFAAPPCDRRGRFARKVRALASRPRRRRAMGTAARRLYRKRFSWEVVADRVIQGLHAGAGRPSPA